MAGRKLPRSLAGENPLDLARRFPGVRLSETGLSLPPDTEFATWAEIGKALCRGESMLQWAFADWWVFGEHRYGERKATVEAEDWAGPSFETMMSYGTVARKFETLRRRKVLSFDHHRTVVPRPLDEADRLLDWAEAGDNGKRRSVAALRSRAALERPQPQSPPEEAPRTVRARVPEGPLVRLNSAVTGRPDEPLVRLHPPITEIYKGYGPPPGSKTQTPTAPPAPNTSGAAEPMSPEQPSLTVVVEQEPASDVERDETVEDFTWMLDIDLEQGLNHIIQAVSGYTDHIAELDREYRKRLVQEWAIALGLEDPYALWMGAENEACELRGEVQQLRARLDQGADSEPMSETQQSTAENDAVADAAPVTPPSPARQGRGRPKGSKNKPKVQASGMPLPNGKMI